MAGNTPAITEYQAPHPHGILFSLRDYLELVDYTGRVLHPSKRGHIPESTPPILVLLLSFQGAPVQILALALAENKLWLLAGAGTNLATPSFSGGGLCMNRYLAGALGGLLATVPMTVAMGRGHRKLPREQQYPLPPREVTEDITDRLPVRKPRSDTSMTLLTLAAHFLYGAVMGSLWGAVAHKGPRPAVGGAAFGAAVWAASYLGWIPAAKVLRPATQHPARRNLLMLAVHCMWGASTAGWAQVLTEPRTHGFGRKARPRP